MKYWIIALVGLLISCGNPPTKGGKIPDDNSTPNNTNNTNNSGTNGQAECGNGALESGELCDPGLDDGPGACPTQCQAPACHVATLSGSPASCDAECTVEPVGCQDGDGCCPIGCDSSTDAECTNVCGDGTVEENELCDGNCPTQCGAPDACTLVELRGEASRCNAECVESSVMICQGGDGCCPSSCNANNDADCGASCGNGTVEPGESCDGNCPTNCSDGIACTRDLLAGSQDTCNVVCTNEEIRVCQGGDGCCPSGCSQASDSDCSSTCGDGVVDADETCDGNCPTSCGDNDVCTRDTLRGSASNCNVSCRYDPITVCSGGDGCCPPGCTNANDSDCSCVPDTCQGLGVQCGPVQNGCGGTIQCGTCATGMCTNGQCDEEQQPTEIGTPCSSDADCDDPLNSAPFCIQSGEGWPGGYCSASCQVIICEDFVSVCATDPNLPLAGSCLKSCAEDGDCRTGYECVAITSLLGEQNACIPQ